MVVGKKGWIRILEALIAILLIIGFLVITIDKGDEKEELSSRIYSVEKAMLKEIQINETFREYILGTTGTIEFENFEQGLKNHITKRTPEYLNCTSKICAFDNVCGYEDDSGKSIYARSVIITANLEVYSPKQIKLFCWTG